MLKKLSMILIAAVLFMGLLPIQGLQAKAASTIQGGHQTTQNGVFSYQKIKAANVEIGIKITGFNDSTKKVTVPDQIENLPVTEIGDEAFKGSEIEKITLPKDLVKIGNSAFAGTVWLGKIELPKKLTTIGEQAFSKSGIESIKIPDGVSTIERGSFTDTIWLKNIELPKNLLTIEESAFSGARALEYVVLPKGLNNIGASAFTNSGLKEILIPSTVNNIDVTAFGSLMDITIMGSIGSKAEEFARNQVLNGYKFVETNPLITTITIDYKSVGHESGRVPSSIIQSKVEVVTVNNDWNLDKEKEYLASWNETQDGTGKNYSLGSRFISHKNLTLYAQWQPKFTVTFNANNNQNATVNYAQPYRHATAPATPTRANYVFAGWYKEAELQNRWEFEEDIVRGNTELYAQWSALDPVVYEKTPIKIKILTDVSDVAKLLKGITSPFASVSLQSDGVEIATGYSDHEGNFTLKLPPLTANMNLAIQVVDKTGQSKMNILEVLDRTPPKNTMPKWDGVSTELIGTTEAGATVELHINDKLVATTTADEQGNYGLNMGKQKADAKVEIWVKDKSGNTIKEELPILGVVLPLTINPFSDKDTKITGKTASRATVEIYVNDKLLKRVTANKSGEYSLKVDKKKAGATIKVIAKNQAGNTVTKTAVVLDKTPPKLKINPVSDMDTKITGTTEANATVEIYINDKLVKKITANKSGDYSYKMDKKKAETAIKVIAKDKAGNPVTKKTKVLDKTPPTIPTVGAVTTKTKKLKGKAEAGAIVSVYNGKRLVGKATANEKGEYSVKIKKQKKGTVLTIYAEDKAKNRSESVEIKVKKVYIKVKKA